MNKYIITQSIHTVYFNEKIQVHVHVRDVTVTNAQMVKCLSVSFSVAQLVEWFPFTSQVSSLWPDSR